MNRYLAAAILSAGISLGAILVSPGRGGHARSATAALAAVVATVAFRRAGDAS